MSKSPEPHQVSNYSQKPMWLSSIYVQIDKQALDKKLLSLARELDCDLLKGDTSDIIATPFFITVVDRNVVGQQWWDRYLEYRIETGDQIPCIIVDNIDRQGYGKHKNIFYMDDPYLICNIIRKEKKRLNRFEFYYTNPIIQRVKMEMAMLWARIFN